MVQTTQFQSRQLQTKQPQAIQEYLQGCLYRDMKMSEINILKNKIKIDGTYIQKMEGVLPELGEKERTQRETIGIISVKKAEMECKKNLLKLVEDIPECI